MKRKIKRVILGCLCAVISIFILYTGVCILTTHSVMQKAERVIMGEETITDTSSAWYRLGLHKKYLPDETDAQGKVYRIFTWCGPNKGFIYIWYSVKYLDNSGNILHEKRDYCKLRIEKRDGKWELNSFYISP